MPRNSRFALARAVARPVFPDRYVLRLAAATLLLVLLAAGSVRAALVRPLLGHGDFGYDLDLVERPRGAGRADLVLVVSVPNAELAFREEIGGALRGELAVAATVGRGRDAIHREVVLPLVARSRDDATSRTVYQVFTLTLPGVTIDSGPFHCELRDLEAARAVRQDDPEAKTPCSLVETDWYRDVARDDTHGLWLGAPLFLSGAPGQELSASHDDDAPPEATLLGDFLHPNRRYGIEQSTLQVVFDVEAVGLTSQNADHLPEHLLVQVMSTELDYALRDTLDLGLDPVGFVSSGGMAEVSWECDVNGLPPGSYQLSCAPLDGWGNAWITEFDVFWSLDTFARPSDEQFLIGSIVLTGDRRTEFMKAGESGREAILAKFWAENDPDRSTPESEAFTEFHRRMAYVNQYLGGFGRSGPVDDRGLIYLMLGPPDEIQQTAIPINERNFNDAIDRVYNAFLPVLSGEVMRDEYSSRDQAIQAVRQKLDRTTSIEKFKSFALWNYQTNGRSLFPNVYTDMPLGLRFLFLARLGGGAYQLELSNAWDKAVYGK